MTLDEPLALDALRRLAEGPVGSQRGLATDLGVSLGRANYVMRALLERGLVKLENARRNPNRLGYLYVLTPKGTATKAALARQFLKRKLDEYDRLQLEIATLAREAGVPAVRRVER